MAKIRINLSVVNVNASAWNNQGETGYWLGIGFGQKLMNGADVVMCAFQYSGNSAVDQFLCTDNTATGYTLPSIDS